jgi:transcription-repair coupling factor (superfamily II helicase)
MYKRLAEVRSEADVKGVEAELADRYGPLPAEVDNLLAVARFRLLARSAGLTEIVSQGNFIRFGPVQLAESRRLRLQRLYPRSVVKEAAKIALVPRPTSSQIGGDPIRDATLLAWCTAVVTEVFDVADTPDRLRPVS